MAVFTRETIEGNFKVLALYSVNSQSIDQTKYSS